MIFLIKAQIEQNKMNQADRSAEGKKQQRVLSILLLRKKRATGIYIFFPDHNIPYVGSQLLRSVSNGRVRPIEKSAWNICFFFQAQSQYDKKARAVH